MIYTNQPYTNAIQGGPTDAKLKYLDMGKKLIQTKTIIDYFSLSKKSINKNFKMQYFIEKNK
jgi:hypothetical protein